MANIPSRHPDSAQCCGANGWGRLFAPSDLAINKIYSIFLIEPAEVRYVYAANFLGNTVSGLALNPATGAPSAVQNTPFKAAG
jgi:hypothetical protein